MYRKEKKKEKVAVKTRSPSPSPSEDLVDYPGTPSPPPLASPTPTTSNPHDDEEEGPVTINPHAGDMVESLLEDNDGETDEGGANAVKKRKRKSSQVILSEETERQLGEWLEFEVPLFYNKDSIEEEIPKTKPGAGIEKLIQDAAAFREILRDAVDSARKDPEVEYWKGFFDTFAEDAAQVKGDFKQMLKVELSSTMRRFLATQRKGEEASESELLLHTFHHMNRSLQQIHVPPQPAPQPSGSLAADPLLQPNQTIWTLTPNQYSTLAESLRPISSSTASPQQDLSFLQTSTYLQGLVSPTTTTARNKICCKGEKV